MTAIHAPEVSTVLADEQARNSSGNKKPKTAFDRLVIEKEHRSMIVSLVAQHFRDKKSSSGQQQQFDIVKGKGIFEENSYEKQQIDTFYRKGINFASSRCPRSW